MHTKNLWSQGGWFEIFARHSFLKQTVLPSNCATINIGGWCNPQNLIGKISFYYHSFSHILATNWHFLTKKQVCKQPRGTYTKKRVKCFPPEPTSKSPYLSELDFCNSPVWHARVWWTGFLVYVFQTGKKINPVHQTRYFKLENCKNQVQVDKGYAFCKLANSYIRGSH